MREMRPGIGNGRSRQKPPLAARKLRGVGELPLWKLGAVYRNSQISTIDAKIGQKTAVSGGFFGDRFL